MNHGPDLERMPPPVVDAVPGIVGATGGLRIPSDRAPVIISVLRDALGSALEAIRAWDCLLDLEIAMPMPRSGSDSGVHLFSRNAWRASALA